jgi:hypothetical protein
LGEVITPSRENVPVKHYSQWDCFNYMRGDPDVEERIILRWMFRKLEGVVGTEWSWLRIGSDGGHL